MSRHIAALSIFILTTMLPASAQGDGPWWNPGAGANKFKVGDRVHNTVSGYDGVVTETGDSSGYVRVQLDGTPAPGMLLNPKWLKPGGAPPAPQGGQMGGAPGGQMGAPTQAPPQQRGGQQGGGGQFPVGSRVEFDRAEGSQPQFGRWDSGTVIGHDQFGRTQIRSDNGTTYNVTDGHNWILPGGSQTPGPRHDYNDHPQPAAATPNPPANNAALAGGGGGPLTGEWAVVGVDGQQRSGYGMTFNFVGNRYELIHYSGETEAGHFSVNGNTVQMVSEDGTPYGTFQYSMRGNQMVLQSPQGSFQLVPAHK